MTPGDPATQGRLAPTKGLPSRAFSKKLPVIKNFPSFALACDNKQIVHTATTRSSTPTEPQSCSASRAPSSLIVRPEKPGIARRKLNTGRQSLVQASSRRIEIRHVGDETLAGLDGDGLQTLMRIRASLWSRRHPAPPQGGPHRQRAGLLHAGRAPAGAGATGRQAPRPLGRHRHRARA